MLALIEACASSFRMPSLSLLLDKGVRADLVARRITQISCVGARQVATRARLPLVGAACGKAGGVECIYLGGSCSSKADRHAIAGGRFTVARPDNDKSRLFTAEEHPTVTEWTEVLDAKSPQSRIVKRGRLLNVGGADKDVRENAVTGNNWSRNSSFS